MILLTGVTNPDSTTYAFTYDYDGSAELRKVVFPYKGELSWDYRTFTYAGSRSLREVQYRYLKKQSGASLSTYTLTRDDSGDASRDTHLWAQVADAGGVGGRKWTFNTTGTYFGLANKFEGIALSGPTTKSQTDFKWAADSVGRAYVSASLATIDPGQAYDLPPVNRTH